MKAESRTLCDWISLNISNLCSNLSILFRILVTLCKKSRKSYEILENKDSANPWILSASIKIWNLVHDNGFLHVLDPSSIPQCKRKEAVRLRETNWTPSIMMCPGFEEWWLYKWVLSFPKLMIFNFYAQIMPRRFLVDALYVYMCVLCKSAGNWD